MSTRFQGSIFSLLVANSSEQLLFKLFIVPQWGNSCSAFNPSSVLPLLVPREQCEVKGLAQGPRAAVCGSVWDLNSEPDPSINARVLFEYSNRHVVYLTHSQSNLPFNSGYLCPYKQYVLIIFRFFFFFIQRAFHSLRYF